MFAFTPSLDPRDAASSLEKLLTPHIEPVPFHLAVARLGRMLAAAVDSCPPPWPAPGLAVTPEITRQSETWMPLSVIRPVYERFYQAALTYSPVLSCSPFATGTSWAAIVSAMPAFLGHSADPAGLLERLLIDDGLRLKFLAWSFMPRRYYGAGGDRYPGQTTYLEKWLNSRRGWQGRLRCLDAACGDGLATYRLVGMLLEAGWSPDRFGIEGWTLDPLEAWAAAHAVFPHDPSRETLFREKVATFFDRPVSGTLIFRQADILQRSDCGPVFDIITCNGLLGGPIISRLDRIRTVVENLAGLLRPGGILLAADRFHGGWKKYIPGKILGDVFETCGLKVVAAGEGPGGLKLEQ